MDSKCKKKSQSIKIYKSTLITVVLQFFVCLFCGCFYILWSFFLSLNINCLVRCLYQWEPIHLQVLLQSIWPNLKAVLLMKSSWCIDVLIRHLSCVHGLLQRSCVTDVSITYLPQLNTTHCTASSLPCSIQQCSSQRRDGNTTTATYRNAAAVDYERSFRQQWHCDL